MGKQFPPNMAPKTMIDKGRRYGRMVIVLLSTIFIFMLTIQVSAAALNVVISDSVKDIDSLIATYSKTPWVKQIEMFNTKLKPAQIDYINSKLPDVTIGCQVWLTEKHYVRTDATAYAVNHNNKSKKHTSADFYGLRYCPNLMALDLSHNAIDDLSFLEYLPKLRVLLLGDNKIENVFSISFLHDLEYLELFKNRIRDVTPLMLLGNLLDLNLSHNYIDDLFPLTRLDGIERLWIYNSNNYRASDPLPKQTVLELQEALYYTHIDATSYSTLGGWREHERYYVIFNMLHGVMRWLPWDAEGLIPRYK